MIYPEKLDALFHPRCVAVVGASDKPGSVGQAVYANLKAAHFTGTLIPVNPQHAVIQGDAASGSLSDLATTPDLVVVCTPAASVPGIARECGALGIGAMVVISAGFRETGEAGSLLEAELRSVLQRYPELHMIGPNCLGVLNPHSQLNASFSATMPRAGGLAVISQSGALCTAMLDWAQEREIGFSGIISVGNMLDVGFADLIDYYAADEQTSALLLYMESLTDAHHFLASARACTRRKPIVVLKSGRFVESSQAALSHTGAMAGVDVVYDAAFRRAGIERVFSFDDLFDCAKLLERHRAPVGPRLAVVTNAGGPGIMASDAWLAQRGELARLSPDTVQRLNQALPPQWSHGNPIDVLGDARADRYATALNIVASDPGVDSLIVILTPQSMTDPVAIAKALAASSLPADKPILAVWMGGPTVRPGRQVLEAARIPVFVTPEQAVQALAHLVSAGRLRNQSLPHSLTSVYSNLPETEAAIAESRVTAARNAKWEQALGQASGLLTEALAKELLADYGIPVVPTAIAQSSLQAVSLATTFGFPTVLKIVSPDISHKTDVGGVELNLADADAVQAAYQRMILAVTQRQPEARIEGVTVQPMVAASRGIELLLGATRDPIFGPVILVGSGGITAEIQQDAVTQLLPLNEPLIRSMLRELRIYPILEGYRGRPGVNLDSLIDVIQKLAHLIEARHEVTTIEINPLLVDRLEVIALDARIIVSSPSDQRDTRPSR